MPPFPSEQQITFFYTRNLPTTDALRRASTFYERRLGLRLARDQGHGRIYHVTGNAYLGFCDRLDQPTSPTGVVFTLVTDQVDEWCAHLRAQGVAFERGPADKTAYRIYNAFVRDPNGYLIEIQRFWDPLE